MPSLPKPKPKPAATRPKLTNRGPAGLLHKIKPTSRPSLSQHVNAVAPLDRIAPSLANLVVPIGSVSLDPDNARVHPERNLEAIKESLKLYGQVKPIVVRKETKIVVAGNGTLEAAKALGWTKIAASMVDMTVVEATGYGLADNRTAELAKWDFEIVARLDKLLLEANHATVGWTLDELEVLRQADWTPPPIEEGFGNGDSTEKDPLVIGFTPDQYKLVGLAITRMTEQLKDQEPDQAACLQQICKEWLNLAGGGIGAEDSIPF